MPSRRHLQPGDKDRTARALAAMADAARRARADDGAAQEPPNASQQRHPDPPVSTEGDPKSHVRAPIQPDPESPPVAVPPVAPPPSPPPAVPPSPPVVPVLVFDALADEQADAGRGSTPAVPPSIGRPLDEATAGATAVRRRHNAERPPDVDRGLRRAVAAVSAALVVVVAVLVGSILAGGTPPATTGGQSPSALATQPSSTVPVSSSSTTTTTVPTTLPTPPPTSVPTTTVPVAPQQTAPGGPPVLTNLQPSTGTIGQPAMVSGSGFLSPSGHISATVGGQTAPVSCPDQTTCMVTIPPQIGTATAVPVVIITDGGSSNPLTFTLG
jgi:hypothetical protein